MHCDFYDGGVKDVTLPTSSILCICLFVCRSLCVAVILSVKGVKGVGSEILGDDIIC